MAKIEFKSIYTGKQETYTLGQDEFLTSAKCPIDGVSLVAFEGNSGRDVWEKITMYKCPNCEQDYYHPEPEKLQFAKKIIVQERKKKLAELRAHESHLVKFLEAAGEKV